MFKYKFKINAVVVLTLFTLLFPRTATYAEKETNVKAYFIYQFTKFIKWPETRDTNTLVIAIWGENKITRPLKIIAREKSTPKQKIIVKNIETLTDLNKAHILFLPREKSDNLASVIKAIGTHSIVVITEKSGMAKKGAAINFVMSKENIGFEINLKSAKKSNLYISSRLLRLAVRVYGE